MYYFLYFKFFTYVSPFNILTPFFVYTLDEYFKSTIFINKIISATIPTFSVNPFVVLDISESVKLVYNSVDFKGLATGCNVSKVRIFI